MEAGGDPFRSRIEMKLGSGYGFYSITQDEPLYGLRCQESAGSFAREIPWIFTLRNFPKSSKEPIPIWPQVNVLSLAVNTGDSWLSTYTAISPVCLINCNSR